MVRENFNARNSQYQTEMAQNNAMMGGMFGLAGTLGGAAINPASIMRR